MSIVFIVLYIAANELTYLVALHQQMGYVHHASAGGLCWANRIIMLIPCIWYCGAVVGIILFLFSLFGLLHGTVGWILSLPTLANTNYRRMTHISDVECTMLMPANLLCLAFTLLSFVFASYKALYNTFAGNIVYLYVLLGVLAVGFVVRIIASIVVSAHS